MLEEGRPAIKHFAPTSKRGSKWGEVSSIPLWESQVVQFRSSIDCALPKKTIDGPVLPLGWTYRFQQKDDFTVF